MPFNCSSSSIFSLNKSIMARRTLWSTFGSMLGSTWCWTITQTMNGWTSRNRWELLQKNGKVRVNLIVKQMLKQILNSRWIRMAKTDLQIHVFVLKLTKCYRVISSRFIFHLLSFFILLTFSTIIVSFLQVNLGERVKIIVT